MGSYREVPSMLQMRAGHPAAGKAHTPRCRARIEAATAEAGDARYETAETRITERLVVGFPEPLPEAAAACSSSSGAGD